jgi:hypothetical protein
MSPLISDLDFLTETGVSLPWIVWIPNVSSGSPTYRMYRPYRHRIVWIVWIPAVSGIDRIRFFPPWLYTKFFFLYIRMFWQTNNRFRFLDPRNLYSNFIRHCYLRKQILTKKSNFQVLSSKQKILALLSKVTVLSKVQIKILGVEES